jgi:hypothetical protein
MVPMLTCVDTTPAYRLIHEMDDDGGFPERAAYIRALLARTAIDMRSTADLIEERLGGFPDSKDRYRAALVELQKMLGPESREQFVMRGPQAFAAALHVVENALRG